MQAVCEDISTVTKYHPDHRRQTQVKLVSHPEDPKGESSGIGRQRLDLKTQTGIQLGGLQVRRAGPGGDKVKGDFADIAGKLIAVRSVLWAAVP